MLLKLPKTSDDFSTVQTERPHRSRLNNVKKCPSNQNIALFFRSNPLTVALCRLHSLEHKFRTKIEIMYAIESDDFF